MSNKFSKKYRKLLLLRHFIGAFIVFFVLLAVCSGIESVGNNNFYIFIEKVAGYDFACFVHDYEPSIIVFGFLISELFMWIAIERSSSKKILKVLDSLEYVVDNSANNIVLPLEFSDLQNWLNLIKMQNREQQHLLEIEAQKKSDTLTYLAHDIRTPLASVVGYLSLLCEVPDMPAHTTGKIYKSCFPQGYTV